MTAQKAIPYLLVSGIFLVPVARSLAEDNTNLLQEVQLLRAQNALLQAQVQKQGTTLDSLSQKVEDLEAADHTKIVEQGDNSTPSAGGFNFGKVNLNAEGGVAFFNTGPNGFAPDSDFRVDEARVFATAPLWNSVFFFGELDLATRENPGLTPQMGELYVDFEDVSQLWGKDGQFNIRAGRLNIPFGEEYLTRYAMENPLISRSLSDIWGYDEGVEAYGKLGKFSYVAAVQNGGDNGMQNFDGSKSVTGRISFDPNAHWHFSLSGMWTGDIDVQNDMMSAVWFGSGFFRSIGSPATSKFDAELTEADLAYRWKTGHVSAFGGYIHYTDNDPASDNTRDLFYYSIEAQQQVYHKLYAAARFSQIFANHGYPIVGYGNFHDYYFETLTTRIWRASLGLGYAFNENLAVKIEYSLENGETVGDGTRSDENFFGTEAVFKF